MKLLIDTGAGVSIFKYNTVKNYNQRYPENVTIQGITNQKLLITRSVLIPFAPGNPHKIYIYDLNIEFDGILGLDFFDQYNVFNL